MSQLELTYKLHDHWHWIKINQKRKRKKHEDQFPIN
jgi:hypothetical protein